MKYIKTFEGRFMKQNFKVGDYVVIEGFFVPEILDVLKNTVGQITDIDDSNAGSGSMLYKGGKSFDSSIYATVEYDQETIDAVQDNLDKMSEDDRYGDEEPFDGIVKVSIQFIRHATPEETQNNK